jgi:hypothetical protein
MAIKTHGRELCMPPLQGNVAIRTHGRELCMPCTLPDEPGVAEMGGSLRHERKGKNDFFICGFSIRRENFLDLLVPRRF